MLRLLVSGLAAVFAGMMGGWTMCGVIPVQASSQFPTAVAAPITVQSELGQAIQGEEPRAPAAAPDLSVTPNWEPPTTTAAAAPIPTPTAAARTDEAISRVKRRCFISVLLQRAGPSRPAQRLHRVQPLAFGLCAAEPKRQLARCGHGAVA